MTMSHCANRSISLSAAGECLKYSVRLHTDIYSDGNYGLYLDETLSDGSSARCPTFENEPLCSAGPRQGGSIRFECVGLEIWGVG